VAVADFGCIGFWASGSHSGVPGGAQHCQGCPKKFTVAELKVIHAMPHTSTWQTTTG
jgi:hypothetical protein